MCIMMQMQMHKHCAGAQRAGAKAASGIEKIAALA
jgi:hypothetical protein